MLNFNTIKTRIWDRLTAKDGILFNAEFDMLYENDNFLKNAVDSNALSQRGLANGRVFVNEANPSVLNLAKWSRFEVNGNLLVTQSDNSIEFAALSNLYQSDGSLITTISQIQNKHLYILLTDSGVLHAQVIESNLLAGSSHSYNSNVLLLKDYYANSPLVFSPTKNGYYKNNKRVIAIVRIDASSQIEFFYNLGFGHRFADVQHLAVGQTFTESRWKREHPSCYIPDGATVTSMATEAPELLQVYGSNVLPDWRNRFECNIDLASERAIRDVQEDALQAFFIVTNVIEFPPANANFGGYGSGLTTKITFPIGSVNTLRTANVTRPQNHSSLRQIVKG